MASEDFAGDAGLFAVRDEAGFAMGERQWAGVSSEYGAVAGARFSTDGECRWNEDSKMYLRTGTQSVAGSNRNCRFGAGILRKQNECCDTYIEKTS